MLHYTLTNPVEVLVSKFGATISVKIHTQRKILKSYPIAFLLKVKTRAEQCSVCIYKLWYIYVCTITVEQNALK
jgi:hypothetical protein